MAISCKKFATTNKQEPVEEYVLENQSLRVSFLTYGAVIQSLILKGAPGQPDVVGGYDSLKEYEANDGYQGTVVGRYANRIANGHFCIDDTDYVLDINNGPNTLHGGLVGLDKHVWKVEQALDDRLTLSTSSPHLDQGYPGNLQVWVTYTLSEDALCISYRAKTDRKTVVNLTNHSYFNLTGFEDTNIGNHYLTLRASRYTPVTQSLIPTGELATVEGTPFDFRSEKKVGQDIDREHPQLMIAGGYDHNLVIDPSHPMKINGHSAYQAAILRSPDQKVSLEVYTDQPGMQIYTGNFLHDDIVYKKGVPQYKRSAICIETQHFPDSPNHPQFPDTTLTPEKDLETVTLLRFRW